jgi:hypothetical protein
VTSPAGRTRGSAHRRLLHAEALRGGRETPELGDREKRGNQGGDEFAAVVPWLMLNRGGLSILVHPITDDAVGDHEVNPLWLGEAVAVDVAVIRRRQGPSFTMKSEYPPSASLE